jgi:isochorismate hydrolase
MNNHVSVFIDDEQVVILIDNIQRYFLGFYFRRFWNREPNVNNITGFNIIG